MILTSSSSSFSSKREPKMHPLLLLLLFLPHLSLSLNQEGLYLQRVRQDLSDPTGVLSDWDSRDDTPCNWTGITCGSSSFSVESVVLPDSSLAGPFPIFLCHLPSLTTLSLPNNSINSSIPISISSCQNLTHLDVSWNYLSGKIPATLADLPNLAFVNLTGNSLVGEIPPELGRSRSLETLILNGNLFSGTIPGALGNITTLKTLHLAYNPFSPGRIPPQLGNLSNLEVLWLSSCNLAGGIPDSFSRLGKLSDIEVSNNQLSGPIPGVIFEITSLVQIELFNNSFSGELPESGWKNLTQLRRLDASINLFTGTIPDELCALQLESLVLAQNSLHGAIPESLAQSPNLYDLRLFNNSLSGSLPDQLGRNSRLQSLDVSYNQLSGEIPSSLCEKGGLEELILISNDFSGALPASLSKCQSLIRIRLSNNRFSGEVPGEIWGFPHVYLLDFAQNSFSGSISAMISGAHNLSSLVISKNRFSGSLPDEIGSLSNLVELHGSDNDFSGTIPQGMSNLRQLGSLDLSNNNISGQLPVWIQSLKQLNVLNLASNSLSGEIPDQIGDLPALNYLDLSGNSFSGKIPLGLQDLRLSTLNLSNNHLTGEIPAIYDKGVYRDSFLGNPGLCGKLAASLCQPDNGAKARRYMWPFQLIFIVTALVLISGVAWFVFRYRKFKKTPEKVVAISKWRSFHKLGFSEGEIFDCLYEDNVIGSGSSGKVYKVNLSNNEVVAVKKLWEKPCSQDDKTSLGCSSSEKGEFESEIETLGKIRHKNIVKLWCCCRTGNVRLLVYEYMRNGSLGDLLHGTKSGLLDWPIRFKIALDAADGLSYLHHDCVPPIVHRDVKSNNILLDDEFGARIADFGVAKIIETANKGPKSMSVIAGSCGYIAPEYAYTLRVNEKTDIYSFGVVILELVTGKRPMEQEFGERDLATWAYATVNQKGHDYVIDPKLDSCYHKNICKVLDIGLLCISTLPINRPSMRKVVKMLQVAGKDLKPRFQKRDRKLSPYYIDYDDCDQVNVV